MNITMRELVQAARLAYPGRKRVPKMRNVRKTLREYPREFRRALVRLAGWHKRHSAEDLRSILEAYTIPLANNFGRVSVPRSFRFTLGRWIDG